MPGKCLKRWWNVEIAAARKQPTFSVGCRSQTESSSSLLEVVTGMRETARNAELRATEGET